MAKKFMYVCLGVLALTVAFHLGASRGQAYTQACDIAVGSGTIQHGQQVPLPYYPDGTQASPEECTFTLSPFTLHTGHNSTLGFFLWTDSNRVVHFEQRTIEGNFFDSTARYLIIGVRGGGASSTQSTTWGEIKAQLGK